MKTDDFDWLIGIILVHLWCKVHFHLGGATQFIVYHSVAGCTQSFVLFLVDAFILNFKPEEIKTVCMCATDFKSVGGV